MVYLSDWENYDTGFQKAWGSKASNLGRLAATNYRVPQGIVLDSSINIDTLFSRPSAKDLFALNQNNYLDTGEDLYAVRSSGLAEDGAESSYAGQHDTFLNVTFAGIPEAVKACRESGAKAQAYREAKGEAEQGITVLVQKMVPALISGVTFTADPFKMDLNTSVIEYTSGLGDKLVSGEVNPDGSFEIDNQTGAFTPNCMVTEPVLGRALVEVHKICVTINSLFGIPMDIEWAVDEEFRVWILQARPLTTGGRKWNNPELKGRPVVGGRAEGKAVWADGFETLNTVFDEGNILFAVMTNPHMVPLMVKSSGIATQVGGRTCHAAIVSRELNKPCIVSVGNLNLIPSGTTVILDAFKGTVQV